MSVLPGELATERVLRIVAQEGLQPGPGEIRIIGVPGGEDRVRGWHGGEQAEITAAVITFDQAMPSV